MERKILFHSQNGDVSNIDIAEKLRAVGAHDSDVLYIHTAMNFGELAKGIKRKELLSSLYECIESLGVKTLIFPTFTFSFCNEKVYDVQNSKTPMGALNEYVRSHIKGERSKDPLLSVYVVGDTLNLIDNLSEYSIGKGSNYDRLHACDKKVKFLFFTTDMRECFTYEHYMEDFVKSPYRYNRKFEGIVCDNCIETKKTVYLYSMYANCKLGTPRLRDAMRERKQLSETDIGNSSFCCFEEKDAHNTWLELEKQDPLFMTDGNYDDSIKDMSYPAPGNIQHVK